jgi:hypothetical protein
VLPKEFLPIIESMPMPMNVRKIVVFKHAVSWRLRLG